MNAEPVFVDANVLVYARDARDSRKQQRATEWMNTLWDRRTGRLSAQVLQEFYVTVTQKLKPGMDARAARQDVRDLAHWLAASPDLLLLETAWSVQDQYGLSWWDALIVAAGQRARCQWLLTEDLQEGQALGGLRVVNPFSTAPDEL